MADAAGAAALLCRTAGHPKQQARRFHGGPYSKGACETAPGPIPDLTDGPVVGADSGPRASHCCAIRQGVRPREGYGGAGSQGPGCPIYVLARVVRGYDRVLGVPVPANRVRVKTDAPIKTLY